VNSNETIKIKRNVKATVYTQYGSRVPMILCLLCLAAKRIDLASKSTARSGKTCERCGQTGIEEF
jgi:hypothetical protein